MSTRIKKNISGKMPITALCFVHYVLIFTPQCSPSVWVNEEVRLYLLILFLNGDDLTVSQHKEQQTHQKGQHFLFHGPNFFCLLSPTLKTSADIRPDLVMT